MDWYLMVCFTIIFLSLLECIVVDRLWRANARKIEDEQKNRRMRNYGDKEPRKVKNNRGGGLSFVNEFLIFAEFVRYSNVVYSTEIWFVMPHITPYTSMLRRSYCAMIRFFFQFPTWYSSNCIFSQIEFGEGQRRVKLPLRVWCANSEATKSRYWHTDEQRGRKSPKSLGIKWT